MKDLPFLLLLPLQLQPAPLLRGQQPHCGGKVSLEGGMGGEKSISCPVPGPWQGPQPTPGFTPSFPLSKASLWAPRALDHWEAWREALGFGEGAGRLTLGQSSPAYPARTEKEPMSKTSAPTSSVRGDRLVRGSLPNSLLLDCSERRPGQSHLQRRTVRVGARPTV